MQLPCLPQPTSATTGKYAAALSAAVHISSNR